MFGTKKPPSALDQLRIAIFAAVSSGLDRRRVIELLEDATERVRIDDAIHRTSPLAR
jgi:hypothetical protein